MRDRESGFEHLGDEVRFQGWRIDVVDAAFRAPDGTVFHRDIVRHPGAVAVVPVTDGRSVLLLEQYRGSVDRVLLEIAAGTRDVPGEGPEATAARELAEEVGVRARRLVHLGSMLNSPGFCDEQTEIYMATGLEPCPTDRHGHEEEAMTVREVPLSDVEILIRSGELIDGQTILGLLLARDALARDTLARDALGRDALAEGD